MMTLMGTWVPPEAVCEHCGLQIWQSTSTIWTHRINGFVRCGSRGFGATRATPMSPMPD